MGQEEQSENGGSGSLVNNGKSVSRKPKPRKVPQRGLGVAQLEKLRLEGQQKRDSALPFFPSSSQTRPSSSYLSLSINPCFNQCQSGNLPLFPSFAEIPQKDSIFSPPGSVQCLDANANVSLGWLESRGQAQGSGSVNSEVSTKLWSSCESKTDARSTGFCSNVLWPYESNLTLPLPGLNLQYQQPPSSASASSVVSFASASCSLPATSVTTFRIEPPSNQIYCNSFSSFRLEEDKRIGFKRPYQFSLDHNPDPGPSLPYNVPPFLHHSIGRPDEAAATPSCSLEFETVNPIFREVPSCSTSFSESNPKNENKRKDKILLGDFLTLAPPASTLATATTSKGPKFKYPSPVTTNPLYRDHERVDFESLPYQIGAEDSVLIREDSGPSLQPGLPYYSFFPSVIEQNGQATTSSSYGSCIGGEGAESLDLELRL